MIQDHGVVPKVPGRLRRSTTASATHGQDEAKIVQLRKVESALVSVFGDFLAAMRERDLLASTAVLFGKQPRQRQLPQRHAPADSSSPADPSATVAT